MAVNLKRFTPKQLDDLVWFIFSLGAVALVCLVWALILPLFGPGPGTGANVLGLALIYLIAVFGGAYGATMVRPGEHRGIRWLAWAALLAVLLLGILFEKISAYCGHASCRIG
jgi:hypothetical protein